MRSRTLGGIYALINCDDQDTNVGLAAYTEALLAGGVRWFQLRAKDVGARHFLTFAQTLCPLIHREEGLLFINDRPDIAVLAQADGVHLGQEDLTPKQVRPWLPNKMRIGLSCHSTSQLAAGLVEDVDYLAFGPILPTRSKADHEPVVGFEGLNAALVTTKDKPLVAIGGLETKHLATIRRMGVSGVAMISALRTETPEESARAAVEAWGELC